MPASRASRKVARLFDFTAGAEPAYVLTLDAPASAPPSSRVAHFIQAAIQSGDLAPGTKLPSQRKLAEAFEIAQNTAREAYRLLAERGLVVAEHGRGVFVVDRTGPAGFTPASGGQVCPTCGALVDVGAVGRHLRWHSLVAG